MLSKLSDHFYTWARGWLILATCAAFVIFAILVLPGVEAASGDTEGLDYAKLYYTPEEAFATVASYDDVGRATLRVYYLTGDVVNPILYTSIFALLISWLFQRGFKPESKMRKLNVIPIGAAVFDLLENISIFIMLSVYPTQPTFVAWLSTVGTTTKYLFFYGSCVLVLIGLVKAAMNKFRKRSAGEKVSTRRVSNERGL
jgi:hypothetical protein